MTKLFVGGFPLDMTEMELVQLISPYGTVKTIKVVRDKKSGKCKGYAFLEMNDQIDAENAIDALDGTMNANRVLSLKIVEEMPAPKVSFAKNWGKPKPGAGRPAAPNDIVRQKRPRN